MEIVFLVVVLLAVIIGWNSLSKPNQTKKVIATPSKNSVTTSNHDKYEGWLKVFREEKSNIREFDLFSTKAAVAWNDNDSEIIVICISAFRNGNPLTSKFDYFEFNVKEKYWTGATPIGSPARIREELKNMGLI